MPTIDDLLKKASSSLREGEKCTKHLRTLQQGITSLLPYAKDEEEFIRGYSIRA